MSKNAGVQLEIRVHEGRVVVDVHNLTGSTVTLVRHLRSWSLELLDGRGQFTVGEGSPPGLPSKSDFVDVEAGQTLSAALDLATDRAGDRTTVGPWTFSGIPERTELRVSYKPDALVPNLPSKQRRTFFRGPLQATARWTRPAS